MAKEFLKHIVEDIKNYHKNILLVENNDGFLFREDIIKWFEQNEIIIVSGTSLQQRIQFELRKKNQILLYKRWRSCIPIHLFHWRIKMLIPY